MALPNTHYGSKKIGALLTGKKKLWFIGIGGIHMSAMAELAAQRGFTVAGSDRNVNGPVQRLREKSIAVYPGHAGARVAGADAVIYTLAVSPENPEYSAAKALGIPTFSRADFLGYLMSDFPVRVGIAGSHGKSTVTAMTADIFRMAGRSPTVLCGARMRPDGDSFLPGEGSEFIFEACEYEDSFLCFSPTVAVILNAELDHVDYFASEKAIVDSFAAYASLPGPEGTVLFGEGKALSAAVSQTAAARFCFGLSAEADFFPVSVHFENGCGSFILSKKNGPVGRISLSVPGEYNVLNAVAAAGVGLLCGINGETVCSALTAFRGACRRMEYRGLFHGARIYDDYAHHPTEISATLKTARNMTGKGRLFVVFQSHTYSRTAAFFEEICAALCLADRVMIAEIYAARETDCRGMSAEVLANGVGEKACAPGSFTEIAQALDRELCSGDLAVVMGAGNIDLIFPEIFGKHFTL